MLPLIYDLVLNQQRPNLNSQQVVQDAMMQQSIQNAPWQQPQGGFGGFPVGPPPQIQQGIPPRVNYIWS